VKDIHGSRCCRCTIYEGGRGDVQALSDSVLSLSPCPRAVSIVVGPYRSGTSQIFWSNPTQIRSLCDHYIAYW
jgi:hypothetical protein